jgi:hypothetical protein
MTQARDPRDRNELPEVSSEQGNNPSVELRGV